MRREELEILIRKFYEGTSTPEEESALIEYFNSQDVPPEYDAEKAMFRYFRKISSIPEPSSSFEDRIIKGVETSAHKGKIRFMIYSISAAAASIILIISSIFFLRNRALHDTYTDPKIAYAETMKILYDISVKLNNGTAALKPVSKMNDVNINGLKILDESMVTVRKELGNIEYLDKALDLTKKTESRK